jgi:hypothetical protein
MNVLGGLIAFAAALVFAANRVLTRNPSKEQTK